MPNALGLTSTGRVAKEGGILIVPRGALLPPYCIKCGLPTQGEPIKQKFRWHEPWIAIFIFLGLLPYVIAAAITSKKMHVAIPLCVTHQKRRKNLLIVGLALLVLCTPVGISIGRAIGGPEDVGWSILVGLIVFISALVVLLPMRSVLRPVRIDEFGGRFQKAGRVFLSLIPQSHQAVAARNGPSPIESRDEPPASAGSADETGSIGPSDSVRAPVIFCNYCRASNPSDALYCSTCGREIYRPNTAILGSSERAEAAAVARSNSLTAQAAKASLGAVGSALRPRSEAADQAVPSGAESSQFLVSASTAPLPVYATMSQRLGAYIADFIVIYLAVYCAYFVSAFIGHPLPSENDLQYRGIWMLTLFVYMTIAQAAYHTTVGKYVLGLEVGSANSAQPYPPFGRILLRETVGRIASLLLWGAGYWVAVKHPRKQAWSDRMANTVVRVRSTNPVLRRALTAFLFVALIADVAGTAWGYYVQDRTNRYTALVKEEENLSTQISNARGKANQVLTQQPKNLEEWQADMRELLAYLDQYDHHIDSIQTVYDRALNEGLTASEAEKNRIRVLQRVFQLRKQQSMKQREEANLVLQFDSAFDDSSALSSRLKLLDSDISALEHQASQMLAESGIR